MITILGRCPKCHTLDQMYAERIIDIKNKSWNQSTCTACKTKFDDGWLTFIKAEEQRGNKLIPVLIKTPDERMVTVTWPIWKDILFLDLINKAITSIICVVFRRYQFDIYQEEENTNKLRGFSQGKVFEVIQSRSLEIGIYANDPDREIDKAPPRSIFRFVGNFVRQLLIKELIVCGENFGRGEILKIPADQKEKARELIWLTIYKISRYRELANLIFANMGTIAPRPLTKLQFMMPIDYIK